MFEFGGYVWEWSNHVFCPYRQMVFVLLFVIFILLQIFSLNLSFASHASQVVLVVKNLLAMLET